MAERADDEGRRTRLLEALPADGSARTNKSLRQELGLSEEDYWRVRGSLLEQGKVVRRRGRGGSTARATPQDSRRNLVDGWPIGWVSGSLFAVASVLLVVALIYAVAGSGEGRLWNAASIVFGAATIAAIGLSVMIFRVQVEMQREDQEDQAVVLRRIEWLGRDSARLAGETHDLVQQMQPAKDASAGLKVEASGAPGELGDEDEPESEATSDPQPDRALLTEDGWYYPPRAVPLKVVADLVRWWEVQGELGRWRIANLVGGFRRLNDKGNVRGVPWVLRFRDSAGDAKMYSISYSGRKRTGQKRATPSVSVYTAESTWELLSDPTTKEG